MAQDAEILARRRRQHAAFLVIGVVAHAEKDVVVEQQPFEELDRLGDLVDRQRRRIGLEIGNHGGDAAQHGAPVGDRVGDLAHHLAELGDDLVAFGRLVDALEMDVDDALAPDGAARRGVGRHAGKPAGGIAFEHEHRVGDEAHLDAELGQFAHHRIEQERLVVIDEFEHRDVLHLAAGGVGR